MPWAKNSLSDSSSAVAGPRVWSVLLVVMWSETFVSDHITARPTKFGFGLVSCGGLVSYEDLGVGKSQGAFV